MKISVKLPVMIILNNMGAFFLTDNAPAISHTKHMNIKQNYLNKYIDDRIVNIVFVKSVENDSNILIKKAKTNIRNTERN